jgi:hypothetical protein
VFSELTKLTGQNIIYSNTRLPKKSNIQINFKNESLETILLVILDDYNLTYKIIGNQIVIVRNDEDTNKEVRVYGNIKDEKTGEVLPYATVYLPKFQTGTSANGNGFYSLLVKNGDAKLVASYVGYKSDTLNEYFGKDSLLTILLTPNALLNEIKLSDSVTIEKNYTTISQNTIDQAYILNSLHLGGEADIMRTIANDPGISLGADGFGGMSVRGGNTDQNLVLLDGVPIYNTGHALGLISIFNSSVIKNATLIKGGFPARYGGRLSSVLDIKTREGNLNKIAGDVNLSILAAKATLEGPIKKGSSSFLFSARRTYADPWLKGLTKYQIEQNNGIGESNYYFYDLNGKINFNLGKSHKVFLSSYFGADEFNHNSLYQEGNNTDLSRKNWEWGNSLHSFHLNSRWGSALFSRLIFYSSDFKLQSFENDRYLSVQDTTTSDLFNASIFDSNLKSLGAKFELDYFTGKSHYFKIGFGMENREVSPSIDNINNLNYKIDPDEEITINSFNASNNIFKVNEISFFAEDEISMNYAILNIGVHTNISTTNETEYLSIQPRFSILVPGDFMSFKAGVAKMNQNIHQLSSHNLGLPNDIWISATDYIQPASAWNFNAGIQMEVGKKYLVGMEGFYKKMNDLRNLPEGAVPDINNDINWDRKIPLGEGTASGVEFFINKEVGQTKWRFNYTFQNSTRVFNEVNLNREFIYGYNRDHNIKINFRRSISENTEFNLIYNFATGNYVTVPLNDIISLETPNGSKLVEIYDAINNQQLPNYQRLDIGFSFFSKIKNARQRLFLGVYNVLNKKNPLYIDIERDLNSSNKFNKVQYSILPVFPTFSYSLAF